MQSLRRRDGRALEGMQRALGRKPAAFLCPGPVGGAVGEGALLEGWHREV